MGVGSAKSYVLLKRGAGVGSGSKKSEKLPYVNNERGVTELSIQNEFIGRGRGSFDQSLQGQHSFVDNMQMKLDAIKTV